VELHFHPPAYFHGMHRDDFTFYFIVRIEAISKLFKYLHVEMGMLSMERFLHVGCIVCVSVYLPDVFVVSFVSLFLLCQWRYLRVTRLSEFSV
jgi:hypothetical protein